MTELRRPAAVAAAAARNTNEPVSSAGCHSSRLQTDAAPRPSANLPQVGRAADSWPIIARVCNG